MFITLSKDALLKLLEAQEVIAKKEDAKSAKFHQKDEAAALVKFRERLKAALKWDYATAKKSQQDYTNRIEMPSPKCPRLEAPRFRGIIEGIKLDMRKSPYRIHDGGDLHRALNWKPESQRVSETVCG